MNTTDLIAQRGLSYGPFNARARVEQNIKQAMRDSNSWITMPDDCLAALEMIAVKISRLCNGDPEHLDTWRDIAGYAECVAERLTKEDHSCPS